MYVAGIIKAKAKSKAKEQRANGDALSHISHPSSVHQILKLPYTRWIMCTPYHSPPPSTERPSGQNLSAYQLPSSALLHSGSINRLPRLSPRNFSSWTSPRLWRSVHHPCLRLRPRLHHSHRLCQAWAFHCMRASRLFRLLLLGLLPVRGGWRERR